MCLDSVEFAKCRCKDYFVGYKVFKERLHLGFVCQTESKISKTKWMEANKNRRYSPKSNAKETLDSKENYELGFHIFTTLKGARAYKNNSSSYYPNKIYEVRFKDIVAFGEQYESNIVVARKMKLVKEIK